MFAWLKNMMTSNTKKSLKDDHDLAYYLQQEYQAEVFQLDADDDETNETDQQKWKNLSIKKDSIMEGNTPDVHKLFEHFNEKFFNNELKNVKITWSTKLTYMAGYTRYNNPNSTDIVLSQPLLSLRPHKDVVETLLHEMIHAYLFQQGNQDHVQHGPSFIEWMERINKEAGTNIPVYHKYHKEVDFLRQYWWRCNGECSERPPYYGLLRRAVNRAPGPHDRWWKKHQRECGGQFCQVRTPDPPPKCKSKESWTKRLFKKKFSKVRFDPEVSIRYIPSLTMMRKEEAKIEKARKRKREMMNAKWRARRAKQKMISRIKRKYYIKRRTRKR